MLNSRSDHGFRFHSPIPEVAEEGSHSDGEPQSGEELKHMSSSPANIYGSYLPQTHHHNESTSTSASESAGSSPTTTLSLADDSSVTEMSPGSSPESPMAKPAISASTPAQPRPHTSDEPSRSPPQASAFFDLHRPMTPGKRPRNLKNLAVNTTGAASTVRGAATSLPTNTTKAADTLAPLSIQESSFTRPPSPPKRRPSNLSLTIVTPANNVAFSGVPSAIVPPTPSLLRPNTLRHFQSSPALPLTKPGQALSSAPPLPDIARPLLGRSQSDLPVRAEDEGMNYELPQSREEKPEAYPDGPICIFDPYVDLYLEPTAVEASKYDVILNVASEVRNPFAEYSTPDPTKDAIRIDGGGGIQFAPTRPRNTSESSDATVLKNPPESSSPTTPKATPEKDTFPKEVTGGDKKPEYIHIPWEHNTDIVPDLLRLVKLIDDRVRRRKRVLIHCQCGVSRSATLVVAYCMFLNPRMSVQEAYDTVKRRSKWIGPNMNLIMQLQEFSSHLAGTSRRAQGLRSLTPVESSGIWNDWRRSAPGLVAKLDPNMPKTAPLPPPGSSGQDSSIDNASLAVTPGPSSAPSGLTWPTNGSPKVNEELPTDRKDARASSVPGVSSLHEGSPDRASGRRRSSEKKRPQSLRFDSTNVATIPESVGPLVSPRSEEFAMTSLQPPVETAADDHFGIMSPTSSAFSHTPLDRDALLGSLGMGSAVHDNTRRRTQNFSFPFRKPLNAPTAVEVATGAFIGNINRGAAAAPVKQTTLVTPSLSVDSLLDPLMSPRASSFTLNPFEPTPLAKSSLSAAERMSDEDPRSPAQKGSNPIVRSIADAL